MNEIRRLIGCISLATIIKIQYASLRPASANGKFIKVYVRLRPFINLERVHSAPTCTISRTNTYTWSPLALAWRSPRPAHSSSRPLCISTNNPTFLRVSCSRPIRQIHSPEVWVGTKICNATDSKIQVVITLIKMNEI